MSAAPVGPESGGRRGANTGTRFDVTTQRPLALSPESAVDELV
jgi:hypothetical protein